MPEYVCPNCRGGFPGPSERFVDEGDTERQCPWCGQALDGSHDPQPRVRVVRSDDDDEPDSILGRWLG